MFDDRMCHVSASFIDRHTLIGFIIPQEVLNVRHAPVPLSEFPFELIVLCSIMHCIKTFQPFTEKFILTDLHCEREGQLTVFMTRKKGALSCPAFLELEKAGASFYVFLGFLKSNSLERHFSEV